MKIQLIRTELAVQNAYWLELELDRPKILLSRIGQLRYWLIVITIS